MALENRQVGYIVLAISGVIAFIIISFNRAMTKIVETSCEHGASCPMWGTIEFQTSVSIALNALIAVLGLYLVFFQGGMKEKKQAIDRKDFSGAIRTFSSEEKAVFDRIFAAGGSAYQSDLIKATGFSKLKMTRVLDKLESKNVIERKRRGMANIVVLKG